ncbi:MAG: ParA family protein [Candidatus Lokiarchaeota archaeon]
MKKSLGDNLRVISFISASGGVGKTKLSLLFSCFLKKMFHSKVLLIDLDPSAAASMSILEDTELEDCMDWKSLARMMELSKKQSVRFQDYKMDPMIYRERIDFLAPGDTEQVVEMVNEFWKSASAGAEFLESFERIIPVKDYDFIIFDTIPFFDPRYTQLVLYPSDYIIIPLWANLVDLKRTDRMLDRLSEELRHKIRFNNLGISEGQFMKDNIFYGFNMVPSKKAREAQFVRYYLTKKYKPKVMDRLYRESNKKDFEIKNFDEMKGKTKERARSLEHHAEKLDNKITLIPSYIGNYISIDRFPHDRDEINKDALDIATSFLNGIYDLIFKKI